MAKSKKVKLHNAGQRKITIGDIEFAPKQIRSFGEEDAKRLLSLYAGEVEDVEAVSAKFNQDDDTDDEDQDEDPSWKDQTVDKIKEYFDALEIKYPPKAKKAVYVSLAEHFDSEDEDETDHLSSIPVKDLQDFLQANEIDFETDANKDALIEKIKGMSA